MVLFPILSIVLPAMVLMARANLVLPAVLLGCALGRFDLKTTRVEAGLSQLRLSLRSKVSRWRLPMNWRALRPCLMR